MSAPRLGRPVVSAPRPALAALAIADRPAAWAELGFAVDGDVVVVGGVRLLLGQLGTGITAWAVRGAPGAIDGLPTVTEEVVEKALLGGASSTTSPAAHPNGALAVDHVVVLTPDFERTAAALTAAAMPLRRVREVPASAPRPAFRQGFRRLGPTILELVETPGAPAGPARFWGLTVTVRDLDALAARLGERLGSVRPAVQPGRHIATLRREAGLSVAVAFMDPEPPATG